MSLFTNLFGNKALEEGLKEGATIIDVRSPMEFNGGHVKGSINIPLDEIESQQGKIKSLQQPLIMCCASGMRSGIATSKLKKLGLNAINGGSWQAVNSKI